MKALKFNGAQLGYLMLNEAVAMGLYNSPYNRIIEIRFRETRRAT